MQNKFTLQWVFEPFESDSSFYTKKMFGGLSAYVHGKLVMCLGEKPGDKVWKGKTYHIDLWDGVLLPTDKDYHKSIQSEFTTLKPHPVLQKWLYLPINDPNFETIVNSIGELIKVDDPRFGVYPKD